ncbi:flagella cluster protein [Halobacteriales archaeon Cl-PHB]
METLDVAEGFDVHDYRHGLKLLQEDRGTIHLANRNDFACPACGKPFEKLFVTEKRENTFGDPGSPFCIVRADDQLLLLTH